MPGHGDEQQSVGVPLGGILDCLLHFRDVLAGNGDVAYEKAFAAVHDGVGGMQAPVPQLGAGVVVVGSAHLNGVLPQHFIDDRGVAVDLVGGAVDVDEHDRIGIGGIAGVGELLQSGDFDAGGAFRRRGTSAPLNDG